jgi:hypothetical protein
MHPTLVLNRIPCGGTITLAQDRDQRQALVNITNPEVPEKGKFLTS